MRMVDFRRLVGILLCGGVLLHQEAFSQPATPQWPSWPLPPSVSSDGSVFFLDMETALHFQTIRQHVLKEEGTLSRLDWGHLFPVVAITFQAQPEDWWFLLSTEAGIPLDLGTVEDWDFQPGTSNVTHYSQHHLRLDNRLGVTVAAGYNVELPVCLLRPQLGFSYRRQTMSGQDGYLQYPVAGFWTGREPQEKVNGRVLQYQLNFFMPSVGLFARFNTHFPLTVEAGIIPYLWVNAVDSHFVRLRQFNDYMHGGPGCWLELGLQLYSLHFSLGVEYLRAFSGKTVSSTIGTNPAPSRDSTSTPAYDSLSIYLSLSCTFLAR